MLPTASFAPVQIDSRRVFRKRTELQRQSSKEIIAPERYVPGGGEQLPGWVVSCTATSCSCSRGRPPHLFAPANHKCGNICPQTGMCSLSMATPPCGGATVFTKVHSRTTRRFIARAVRMVWYGMVEVCEGAPVAVSGWVLTDRHDVRPCAASSLHRETISVSNIIGVMGNSA